MNSINGCAHTVVYNARNKDQELVSQSFQKDRILYIGFTLLQWTPCIMDILGPTKSVRYQGVLIFQVILFDKVPFGITA